MTTNIERYRELEAAVRDHIAMYEGTSDEFNLSGSVILTALGALESQRQAGVETASEQATRQAAPSNDLTVENSAQQATTEYVKLIDALVLCLDAMNYMGDILNGMDAVERDDIAKTSPAFDAARAVLGAHRVRAAGAENGVNPAAASASAAHGVVLDGGAT